MFGKTKSMVRYKFQPSSLWAQQKSFISINRGYWFWKLEPPVINIKEKSEAYIMGSWQCLCHNYLDCAYHMCQILLEWGGNRHSLRKYSGVTEQRFLFQTQNIGFQKTLFSDNVCRFLLICKLCLLVRFLKISFTFPVLAELETTLLVWTMWYAIVDARRNI